MHRLRDTSSFQGLSSINRFTLGTSAYLQASVSVLTGEVLDQDGGENADSAVKLPLPEAVVLVGLSAQDADDGAFGKRQLVVLLSRVVVQGLRE